MARMPPDRPSFGFRRNRDPALTPKSPIPDRAGVAKAASPSSGYANDLGVLLESIENMSDGFVLFDEKDRFVLCNRVYRGMYPEVEDLLVPGVTLKEILDSYSERAEGWAERFYEERLSVWKNAGSMEEMTPSGRWIETRDQTTTSGYRVGIRIDVTERRRAEMALRESEARFRTLVENAPEAMVVLDVDQGRFVDVNENAVNLFKLEAETLCDLGPAEVSPPIQPGGEKSTALAKRYVKAALKGERPIFEWTHRDSTGKDISCEVRLVRLPASGRHLVRGSVIDIGAQKRTLAELAEKSSQLETILESMDEGITMVNSDLRMVAFNRKYLELFELPPDSFRQGEPLEKFLRFMAQRGEFGSAPIEDEVQQRLARVRRPEPRRARHIRPNGTVLEIRSNPLPEGGRVETYADVTETHKLSEKLAHQATHDSLTGLVNRWEFERRLRNLLGETVPGSAEHALCYLDLDQFKVINDTCGHTAGDELLRRLGALLPECVRRNDTLARLGGDEFGVLLQDCSLARAHRVAAMFRRTLEEFQFTWGEKIFKVSVSIGMVPITGIEDVSEILRAADSACYAAKEQGRNRIHVYDPDDVQLSRQHGEMQWVTRIHHALKEDRLRLYAQRILPLGSEHTQLDLSFDGPEPEKAKSGEYYELLVRVEDEQGRLILPGAFLPAAERYNLASRIDRWVISAAFDWLTQHRDHLREVQLCTINLSGVSLGDEAIMRLIEDRLDKGVVQARQICFEVTETAAVGNFAEAKRFVGALRKRGCRFALDDFGSGVSSFGYLKSLPVDFVKIDGTFVRDIDKDPIDFAMVRSINEIGHIMGKQTIAEFVDSKSVLQKLREIGVDFVQGYAISMPEPVGNLVRAN